MDVCRPIGNIYHSKLAIAVDWIVFVDNTQKNGNNNVGNRMMTPVSSGIAAGMLYILISDNIIMYKSPVLPTT